MERNSLAQNIIDTCLEMNATGLNQGTSGNVSVRYQDGMLITPSGIPYVKLTPEMIVYVDENGVSEPGKVASSEWLFHLACYRARGELNAVIHTHAVNSTAVAIMNHAIPAIHYMVAVTGTDHIPCIPYDTFGTKELAESVFSGIKESKSILMQHHGMLAMEINLEKALWLAGETETLAELYLKVGGLHAPPPVLPADEMKKVIGKFKNYGLKTEK
ncbi:MULTISPECIES: L-fuculose-phosphate aldolase [Buttiauxella]|uniref:L-fuculose-phosphate aldolase n=1 Tax=Buttiauxella TaxID=82976 RepID=UPI001064E0D7|nr:L-fuculose-phosphate aldolase [Buttiauxella sp. BIGb0552]TDX14557.1 L-fuculose-phosphate aldolase [Buttiauxella sp. BIGb0552]